MAEYVKDVIEWLQEFDPNDLVGIGEGCLDLRINTEDGDYYEIGGMPEAAE